MTEEIENLLLSILKDVQTRRKRLWWSYGQPWVTDDCPRATSRRARPIVTVDPW